jgi:threonine-phosphate decarboxylase
LNKVHGGDIYEVARKAGMDPAQFVDFSASINPLGLSKRAERKLKEGLSAILHYPDADCAELTRALAEHHGLEEEQILAGAGSTEFIYAIPRVLPIRRALLVTPAFSEYENALESGCAGSPCGIDFFAAKEEDGFEIGVEALLFSLSRGYDALVLCNPNNPTGIRMDPRDLERILSLTEREKIWFILDEAFIDFLEEGSLKRRAADSSRLIILRSLTKFFALPGLRAGYLISNREVVRDFSLKKAPWTVNALAQIAARESLLDKGYIERSRTFVRQERERLIHQLRSIPGFIPYPGEANYLLVQLNPSLNLTAAELREKLIPQGVLVRDCRSFHHLGLFFFRVAVRSRRENNLLIKALRQVRAEIQPTATPEVRP